MAKRDPNLELPHTRRDDEPPPFKPIRALDENIAQWQRKLGSRKKLNQEINALLVEQQELLQKHGLDTYPFESSGGSEREIYRITAVKSRKTKTKAETEPAKGKRGKKADKPEPKDDDTEGEN